MNLDDILDAPVALKDFVRDPKRLPGWAWLYTDAHGPVSLASLCRATLVSSRELSDQESEIQENFLENEGFRCLLSRDQIEQVTANLHSRYPLPTLAQIEEALAFFLAHDAFIVT